MPIDVVFLLSEENREVLLQELCDNCHHCYEGLSEEEFESCCQNCKPVQIVRDLLFTDNEMVRIIYMACEYQRIFDIALKEGGESDE